MSGAGDYGAGDEPAGEYVPTTTTMNAATMPLAPKWDPEFGYTVVDENGRVVEDDPTDHTVAMALGIEFGSAPGSPTTGVGVRAALRSAARSQHKVAVTYAVRTALRRPLDARDIDLVDVKVTIFAGGRALVEVDYFNRRLQQRRTGRISA